MAIRRGQFILTPAKKLYKRRKLAALQHAYHAWATQNEERCFGSDFPIKGPLVSIVVPVYNPLASDFMSMVYSVVNQHYSSWELILVNASSDKASRRLTKQAELIDSRIIVVDHDNKGISDNTNAGLEVARGEYIAFTDHDDLLHACALHACVEALSKGAGLVYTDEDKIKADGSFYFDPFFKPGWSPDLLRNVNYINHLTVVKSEYIKRVKGLRGETDGAQDFDMLLRIIDVCEPEITHIPRVLYHWRAAASSTASDIGTKTYVLDAGTHALQGHLDRTGVKAKAKAIANRPGFYECAYKLPSSVTIVVGPVGEAYKLLARTWLQDLLGSFSEYEKVQIIAGEWSKELELKQGTSLTQVEDNKFWQDAAKNIKGEVAVCFNVATLPRDKHAINKIVGKAYGHASVVSPLVINERNMILDAGLVKGGQGLQPLFTENHVSESTFFGTTEWVRNIDGLTGNVFAAQASTMSDILSHATNQLEHSAFSKMPINSLVVDGMALHVFMGTLRDAPLADKGHFNPQLARAYAPNVVNASAWGSISERAERDAK